VSGDAKKMRQKAQEIEKARQQILQGGGAEKVAKQHLAGKLTARERLDRFFDPGSFIELDMFARPLGRDFGADKVRAPSDGVIIGYGKVNGRHVAAFAQDITCVGGTMGEMHGKKIVKITERAAEYGMPIVGFHESGGARLQEFLAVSREYGIWFYLTVKFSGVIPQLAAMMGTVAGGQAYQPGLSDFVFMTGGSAAFIAGPPLVESMLGEKVTVEELGGAGMHSSVSGVCHVLAGDDADCIDRLRDLLSYLPQNNREKPPRVDTGDDPDRVCERLYEIVPPNPRVTYDMHEVIEEIVDGGSFLEIHREFAPNMMVGLARFDGHSTGIIANNPLHLAGSITTKAAEKATRFIRFCDAFGIPLLYLVSTPAYFVGTEQEQEGMIYRGATLLYATSEATVPKVAVIVGWAYAGAYLAMGSKYLQGDVVYAWPNAEIGLVAAEGVANVLFRKQIAAAENPGEERKRREQEFTDTYMDVSYPASYQHVDDIIDPRDTRRAIIRALDVLQGKRQDLPWKKHGNMPL
jgi:acetyl-CoA carboxylase carboxyltransferase component